MDGLANFFGRKPEDTTEAELHQDLTEARTRAELAEQAKAEGLAAAQTEIDALRADVVRLSAELSDAKETAQTAQTDLETVRGELATTQSDLTSVNAALAQKVKECNALGGEVARLTAGKPSATTTATDSDPQFDTAPVGKGVSVSMGWLEDKIFGKN